MSKEEGGKGGRDYGRWRVGGVEIPVEKTEDGYYKNMVFFEYTTSESDIEEQMRKIEERANRAKQILSANQIPCVCPGENYAVYIVVRREDVERAIKLLKENGLPTYTVNDTP